VHEQDDRLTIGGSVWVRQPCGVHGRPI
jgi:hypothetical protein